MKKINQSYLIFILLSQLLTPDATASIIDINSKLLDQSNATQLEAWIGKGDLDWQSIWYGETGASSAAWHATVDGVTETVSLYDISYAGNNYLVGGYTDIAWNSNLTNPYQNDFDGNVDTFIFNLTSRVKQDNTYSIWPAGYGLTYSRIHEFASFGGGGDLWAFDGLHVGFALPTGTFSDGNNIVTGTAERVDFSINALETFTFTRVPEPTSAVLFGLGVFGLVRIRKSVHHKAIE